MTKFTQTVRAAWIVIMIASLAGCGESEQPKSVPKPVPPPPITHTIGGLISGLSSSGLILQLNGANDLPVSVDGTFKFPKALAKGSAYSVTVKASPSSPVKQTCTIDQGSGNIANANISKVSVTCATISLAVGGTVSGLFGKGHGEKLVLQLNGANDLEIEKNGKFIFPDVRLLDGSDYSVAIKTTPAKRRCAIKSISEAFDNDTLNIVSVTCSKQGHRN